MLEKSFILVYRVLGRGLQQLCHSFMIYKYDLLAENSPREQGIPGVINLGRKSHTALVGTHLP